MFVAWIGVYLHFFRSLSLSVSFSALKGGQTSPIGVTLPPLTGTLLGQLQQNTGVVPQLLEVVSQAVQSLLGKLYARGGGNVRVETDFAYLAGGGGATTLLQGLPGISTLLGQTNGGVLPGLLQVVSQAAQGLLGRFSR